MSEPRYSVEDFNSVLGQTPSQNGGPPRDTWLPLNLADLPDQPPAPPTLGGFGIVYHGKRHVFSGPQESAKTLAAYAIGLETIRAHPDREIMLIDFEMGARPARTRLRELGATNPELAHILYVEPQQKADLDHILLLVAMNPVVVIIDAAAGAYANEGLDDNHRGDVEKFTNLYVRHFHHHEIATIILDHVVKNTEVRGKYAIGSERKTGGVDVHLGFDTIHPIKRGSTGLYKIVTHKDRDGWHQRGQLAELHLESSPITHHITWEFKQAEHVDPDIGFVPTHIMQKMSGLLEQQTEPISRSTLISLASCKKDAGTTAIDRLVQWKYATQTDGPRGAKLINHTRQFTVLEWENEQHDPPVPTCSPPVPGTGQQSPVPPVRSTGEREQVDGTQNSSPVPDIQEQDELPDDGIPF